MMQVEAIVHVLSCMLSSAFLCLYFFALPLPDGSPKIVRITVTTSVTLVGLITALLPIARHFRLAIVCGVAALLLYRCGKLKGQRFWFLFASSMAYASVAAEAVYLLRLSDGFYRQVVRGVLAISMLLLMRFFLRPKLVQAFHIMQHGWIPLLLVPLALFITANFYAEIPIDTYGQQPHLRVGMVITWLTTAGAYLAIVCILKSILARWQSSEDLAILRTQMTAFGHQVSQYQRAYEENRIAQHDSRHYTRMLYSYNETGNTEGIKKILGSIEHSMAQMESAFAMLYYTGVAEMDVVLSTYQRRASSEGIDLQIHVVIPPIPLPEVVGLALSLSNGLENALNACGAIQDGHARIVRVEGNVSGSQFVLSIANTCSHEVRLDPVQGYPRAGEVGHGFGTRSIATYVARCGGVLDYKVRGGWFHLRMALPLEENMEGKTIKYDYIMSAE